MDVSLDELEQELEGRIDRVLATREELVVTGPGREPLVIMPFADLNRMREALDRLSKGHRA